MNFGFFNWRCPSHTGAIGRNNPYASDHYLAVLDNNPRGQRPENNPDHREEFLQRLVNQYLEQKSA